MLIYDFLFSYGKINQWRDLRVIFHLTETWLHCLRFSLILAKKDDVIIVLVVDGKYGTLTHKIFGWGVGF
jgi:hypothetical protein